MDHRELAKYFLDQTGRGNSFVLYKGKRFQKGRGLFGALGSLFRYMSPYVKTAAKSIGKELLNVGGNVLSDVISQKPFKASLNNRLKEGGTNLKRKADHVLDSMLGSGIKARKIRKVAQLKRKRTRRKKVSIKRQKKPKRRTSKHVNANQREEENLVIYFHNVKC